MTSDQRTLRIRHDPAGGDASALLPAAAALRAGMLVAFPTETVYGLGANAFDEAAVRRIFRVKGRPADNPLIVHIADAAQAAELAASLSARFHTLAARFWPGPLTLVVRSNAVVPDVVTAGLETIALRMPAHGTALALIRAAGVPLAAPSANISGSPSPTTADEVLRDLDTHVFAVVDGGPCREGIESTVLDITTSRPRILRPGVVTREMLEDALGVHVRTARHGGERPASPGMKYLHYAPSTPLRLLSAQPAVTRERVAAAVGAHVRHGERVGLMAPAAMKGCGEAAFHSLGAGRPEDYAHHLYLGLRSLDRAGVDVILVPAIAPVGLGLAVMNRLRKAAGVAV